MIHGDACFAYFNKIWDIPRDLSGTRWIGRAISSKFSEFSSNSFYHVDRIGLDTGNVAVDTYIPPIHRDRLGRAVAWDAAADFYQLCGLVVADGRVQHLRFDVAEKPRAP
jgi:hypothetical protein